MFDDDLELLRELPGLLELLEEYARLGVDREAWQDRVMCVAEHSTVGLARLHGWLLAQGWLEQNTGDTSVLKPGTVANCYRVTLAGHRALRQVRQPRVREAA